MCLYFGTKKWINVARSILAKTIFWNYSILIVEPKKIGLFEIITEIFMSSGYCGYMYLSGKFRDHKKVHFFLFEFYVELGVLVFHASVFNCNKKHKTTLYPNVFIRVFVNNVAGCPLVLLPVRQTVSTHILLLLYLWLLCQFECHLKFNKSCMENDRTWVKGRVWRSDISVAVHKVSKFYQCCPAVETIDRSCFT